MGRLSNSKMKKYFSVGFLLGIKEYVSRVTDIQLYNIGKDAKITVMS